MPDTKHVTEEMVEAAVAAFVDANEDDDNEDVMRAALTAALALLPKGTEFLADLTSVKPAPSDSYVLQLRFDRPVTEADGYALIEAFNAVKGISPPKGTDFRAGAEMAIGIINAERMNGISPIHGENADLIIAVAEATLSETKKSLVASIRAALAALPEGGDVKSQFLALADMMERVRATPEGVKLLTDLFEAMVKPLGIVFAMVEEIGEAAETILDVANYLKGSLDEDLPVYESKWLDGLMEVHGALLGIVDAAPPAAPQTRDAGGGT